MKLSVIVPVFNEQETVDQLIRSLKQSLPLDSEIIVVDDGSTDASREKIMSCLPDNGRLITNEFNLGKTSAVLRGLAEASGEWIIVQDADLEYDPHDITRLLEFATGESVAVYGKRTTSLRGVSRWHFWLGVWLVDTGIYLTCRRWIGDHASCYKLISKSKLQSLNIVSSGFEGCVEITIKLLRSKVRIIQVPISYDPRTLADGKKLKWTYGFTALAAVVKFSRWYPA